MERVRPVACDHLVANRGPVVASRQTPADKTSLRVTPVTHSYATMAFYTGGRARMEQNGEWNLGEGDVLLIPAGEPHRMLEMRGSEFWGLALDVPCFAADDGTAKLLQPFERVRDGGAAVVHVPTPRRGFLAALFAELQDIGGASRGPSNAIDAVQTSLLTLILAEIERAAHTSASVRAPGGGVVVESLRFIERNCLRRLSLDDVAKAVGRSPTYVTTALTQATGRSAGDWIVAGRMAEARRLLLHSNERVDIIAERVGYVDATHFIRMFRRAHGTTPAAWRAAKVDPPLEA